MPVDISERVSEINPILSFLRVSEDRQLKARPSCRAFCFSTSLNGGAELLEFASFFEPETDLMQQFFSKTFGGLTPSYYIRQMIFGSASLSPPSVFARRTSMRLYSGTVAVA